MKKHLMVPMALVVISIIALVVYPACKESEALLDNPLANTRWILESFEYANQNIINVEDPFWIQFNEDNTLEMQVDCNICRGTYDIGSGNIIRFNTPFNCTEVYCGDDSLDREFLLALDGASRYEFDGNRLRIYFGEEGSRLNFIAAALL
ncbi:MAG: META domain-containing protein [Candidatus Aminicenantes bacterium]|nr:MAG: META domain-containing protein [Candidatus Aminicenantes bacterium]